MPRAYCLCEDDSVIGTPFYIMEFLDGRIFEDPVIPNVLPDHRRAIWADAVRTLAKLHRIDPKSVGLESFGRHDGFYNRQIATWKQICGAQAAVEDVDTKEQVGQLPFFEELMAFFSDGKAQPADKGTLIHGDFKIDNLVFHKTEPRVIGILEYDPLLLPCAACDYHANKCCHKQSWEMSTIGHPLSDLANLLTPYYTAFLDPARSVHLHPGFLPKATRGLPSREDLTELYFAVLEPEAREEDRAVVETRRRELQWAQAFSIFRLAAICQGIAARLARRQASSEQAKRHGDARTLFAEFAWELAQSSKGAEAKKSKL